ncbi:MAG: hypothetical protein ACK4M6_06640 [Hyphomonas sp.]
MNWYFRPAAMAMLATVLVAGAAQADVCSKETVPKALETSMQQISTAEQFQQAIQEMDGYLSQCPDDPWINMMGASMDMRVYDTVVFNSNNKIGQDAVNYLLRAFARSDAYMAVPPEARQNLYAVPTEIGVGELTHAAAAENRKSILTALMQLARLGTFHPYIAAEAPPACSGWLNADAQTIGYTIDTEADMIFLPFVDAAAEACRNPAEIGLRLPLSVKAHAYTRLVGKDVVTDPERVADMLLKARDARDAYLEGRSFDAFYTKYDAGRLDNQLRKHGADPQAGLLARDLWFTPEHMRTEKMQFSLGMALSEEWATIAAAMSAGTETPSSAGARFTSVVYAVLHEGRAAGLEQETRTALRFALGDVQENRLRAPALEGQEPPPQWLYDILMKTAAAPTEGN